MYALNYRNIPPGAYLRAAILYTKIYSFHFHSYWGKNNAKMQYIVDILFVWFFALNPKSTAMVMAGRLVHLTTLFPGQA